MSRNHEFQTFLQSVISPGSLFDTINIVCMKRQLSQNQRHPNSNGTALAGGLVIRKHLRETCPQRIIEPLRKNAVITRSLTQTEDWKKMVRENACGAETSKRGKEHKKELREEQGPVKAKFMGFGNGYEQYGRAVRRLPAGK